MWFVFVLLIGIPSLVVLSLPLFICIAAQKARLYQDSDSWHPSISLIAPLAANEEFGENNWSSYFVQKDLGPYEIIFVSEESAQFSSELASSLIARHPNIDARIIFSGTAAEKVAKMHNLGRGIRESKNDIIVFVDSDVCLPDEREIRKRIQPFQDKDIGLITGAPLYHRPRTPGGYLLATMINADLWGYFAVLAAARSLVVANGAFLSLRRTTLALIGNLEDLEYQILNDTAIARKVLKIGQKIALSPLPVHIKTPSINFSEWWSQAIRWHIAMRRVLPKSEYFLYGFQRAPLFLGMISFMLGLGFPDSWIFLAVPLLSRFLSFLAIQCFWIKEREGILELVLVILTDIVSPFIWVYSWVRNRIYWRGRCYRVYKGGMAKIDK